MKKILIIVLIATIAVSWYHMISLEMRIYKAERASNFCRAWIAWETKHRAMKADKERWISQSRISAAKAEAKDAE